MCAAVSNANAALSVKAYRGDGKTLLAFDLVDTSVVANLAGFTIQCKPGTLDAYYLDNFLRFKHPEDHAQVAGEPPNSTVNAPLHKFRWLHVPGVSHQGVQPFVGEYTYTVTPRFFDGQRHLLALDPVKSVAVDIEVAPFAKNGLALGFTRGFVQSQAFARHFGVDARFRPKGKELLFDTSAVAGTNPDGQPYSYDDEYTWSGFTARRTILELLDEVIADAALTVDVFAYDLDEPDVLKRLLALAAGGRIRVILDNAALHHDTEDPTPEDEFEELFKAQATGGAAIKRGKFGRYAHDKVFVVSRSGIPEKLLTGSTNFAVNGLYVNSNHVLVFDDPEVAATYKQVFEVAWTGDVKLTPFRTSAVGDRVFAFANTQTPPTQITFAPHSVAFATATLGELAARIHAEGAKATETASVLFAVMGLDQGESPAYDELNALHANERIFSYGISDSPAGIALYARRSRTGVLVTGKPSHVRLPPPFNQVRILGREHQVHHKFVVCGFNGDDPVVYCGSSNLALGGEEKNGDNLLAIRDPDVAAVFAIEALALVDHFDFLDRSSTDVTQPPPASNVAAAEAAEWFLSTTGKWAEPYFDPDDLRSVDRLLFA